MTMTNTMKYFFGGADCVKTDITLKLTILDLVTYDTLKMYLGTN